MRLPLLIFLFVWAVSLKAQVNLVPNPSFEENTNCPGSGGQITFAEPWYSAYGTVDLYDTCSIGNYNVPNGQGGGGVAHDGHSYTAMGLYVPVPGFENAREFAEVELISQLITGNKYKVEFYVSLVDSAWYAISSMGACLTEDGIGNNLNNIFALTPQIQNPDTFFITAKDKWVMVSGSFYANGTEKYIAIGNFRNDQNTDTIFVYQGPSNWRQAHYYLDDVSVTLDTTTGISETEKPNIRIFPNPASSSIEIRSAVGSKQLTVEIYDMLGQIVYVPFDYAQGDKSSMTIDVSSFSKGIYLLAVKEKGEAVFWEKVVVK